ncbi:MAG TPA: right-handed parallel beta-helix repeat-containing protein, partial [Chitinispirillaceae bacterium]|nr:right-handed parallel beta-helix repeat-containing protein [Chitinispirillaceae bacterium]
MNRLYLYIFAVTFLFLTSVPAATLTVSKDGTATYNTIQAAVSAASAGDNIEILDQSIYEEQVTFDSTKKNLTLQAKTGVKPVICYQDTIHIHPVNATEATALNIDFDRNGVIRIIKAANITIANIIIRGKIATTFGDDAVWGTSPFQFGNTGISILSSSNIVIRNCDISNTFIGIYFKDYSTTGLFTSEVPDKDEKKIFCGFGKTGNHLFERNRIHNNSWGIFCESAYDLGSSIRYNLFYENHHYSDAFAETVNKLTSDGFEQTGGAICLKDNRLSPLAIYNNTFWHNFALIGGHWQAGAQQLIFNNIYAEPNQYWVTSANTGFTISTVEMSSRFKSRMFNCVYAAQEQAPQENEVKIMFGLSSFASSPVSPGQIINTPFTADENIRWLETKFKSTDTASPDFLVPDWNDANVQQYILDKGWSGAGILDADGTIADLGALPKGGLPTETIRIMPFAPVSVTSTSAKLGFSLSSDCTLDNPRIKYLKFVTATPESSAVWNQTVCTESASTASLKTGCNILSCAISKTIAKEHYGFFEMV